MITALRAADAHKPFLLYFAHAAVHGPCRPRTSDIADYAGVYDAGWDDIRAAALPIGSSRWVCSRADTALPPANHEPGHDVPPWTTSLTTNSAGSPATWRSTRARSRRSTPAPAG